MGSFFYGNPFGKNTGLYAYIASNMSTMISYENSTFNKEKSEKVTTARVVLGNLIKDTGCFYTYETSFYGATVHVIVEFYLGEKKSFFARKLSGTRSSFDQFII